MPNLETIYAPFTLADTAALTDWMIRAHAYGYVTRNQAKAIVAAVTPALPAVVQLALRTRKGVIYVTANGRQFRIGQRGQLIDKGWNPAPRKPPRNPWAD